MTKKGTMNNGERLQAVLNRKKPDRVPILPFGGAMGFCGIDAGFTIAEMYNDPKKTLAAESKTYDKYDWVYIPYIAYASYGGWEFGGEIKWPRGEYDMAPSVVRPAVETEEDIWKLKKPDVATAGIVPIMTECFKQAQKERRPDQPYYMLAPMVGPFTLAGNICKPDRLCKWMLKKPEVAHHILRLATEHGKDLAQHWYDNFGLDGVLPFTAEATTSNQLISPAQFEQFAFPYFMELHQKVLSLGYKHIYCHICGEQNKNLPWWKQVCYGDPGIITIGHEIELKTAAETFPHDVIMGNLEPAIIQTRNPQEVYEAAKKNIQDGMKIKGGYIFSPGCALPPKAPPDNIMAITRAVNDIGWY